MTYISSSVWGTLCLRRPARCTAIPWLLSTGQHFCASPAATQRNSTCIVRLCAQCHQLSWDCKHTAKKLNYLHTRPAAHYISASSHPRYSHLSRHLWAAQRLACGQRGMHHSSGLCYGFVGESTPAATAYYDSDFSWEELRDDPGTIAVLQRQAEEARGTAAPAQSSGRPEAGAAAGREAAHAQGLGAAAGAWEAFHARDNATARFYKERRYLLLEFPILARQHPPLHVVEIGCGCGSALLPVLKGNPNARVTASDVSPTAVSMFLSAAEKAGIHPSRLHASVHDAALPGPTPLAGLEADVCLIVFTLAALQPSSMHNMLLAAWQALRPGGVLLIRDHGHLDITHLRLTGTQQIAPNYFKRTDGTTCYFFTVEDLTARAEAAGFAALQCSYACTQLRNRKQQLSMKRVFVQGIFEKSQ